MGGYNIYQDIAQRTQGNIYIGVVGPVRTGKSTFIKRFMETLVLPNIKDANIRQRAQDELPQSGDGRTITTTEPKFIPDEAVGLTLGDGAQLKVRMIDCVGYIVENALGYLENGAPRMVNTPWFEEAIPFNRAAETGTKKVITEHSTIGLLITTDGTIGDLSRNDYEDAEKRVVAELKNINKPFVVIINSTAPAESAAQSLCETLENRYEVPAIALDVMKMGEADIRSILERVLFEFPVREINFSMPHWIDALDNSHWLKASIYKSILDSSASVLKIGQIAGIPGGFELNDNIKAAKLSGIDLGKGVGFVDIEVKEALFYKIIGEKTGLDISDDEALIRTVCLLADSKKKYDKIAGALEQVYATGYGIVIPSVDELRLEEPEIIRQGGKYGVRLRASAPSIHMIKAEIETEVSPIVGSERQSEDLIRYIFADYEENPSKIWDSNIFGKSLHELVNEGLAAKLAHMPQDARDKLQNTLERIINEGSGGLLCIIF